MNQVSRLYLDMLSLFLNFSVTWQFSITCKQEYEHTDTQLLQGWIWSGSNYQQETLPKTSR